MFIHGADGLTCHPCSSSVDSTNHGHIPSFQPLKDISRFTCCWRVSKKQEQALIRENYEKMMEEVRLVGGVEPPQRCIILDTMYNKKVVPSLKLR